MPTVSCPPPHTTVKSLAIQVTDKDVKHRGQFPTDLEIEYDLLTMTFWAQPPDHFLPIWLSTHPNHDMHTVNSQYIFHGVQLIWVCWQ